MNLLQETIDDIQKSGHNPEDVIFIGSEESGHSCTWAEFCSLADQDYDESFCSQEVATDLVIVFNDGAKMWRGEYDGSEWWEYSTPFSLPGEKKLINRLFTKGAGWENLETINDEQSQ